MQTNRTIIFKQIDNERMRQDELHGEFNNGLSALSGDFIVMITEELGESAQALQDIRKFNKDADFQKDCIRAYDSELTQVAALAVQIKERLRKAFPTVFD